MGLDVYAYVSGIHGNRPCLVFAPAVPFATMPQFIYDGTPMFRWSTPLRRLFVELFSSFMMINLDNPPIFTEEQLDQALMILDADTSLKRAKDLGIDHAYYLDMVHFFRICKQQQFIVAIA
ncbi:hypothetical protein GZH47_33025 (plasmid) [Paenibacillus rhizovicinus]|uniref:Uncharacterized protein n=1 Tax=Paenibacillus rhizovicinus TaxID=2704463 RepID=A0A6C0PB22_9BACL|nr:hypothetical protein [Paenibacillus rhizovicinus]QHW35718.1 hypothetical protein GZH47_33025 [Paenibacillus rhizovicinus]